MEKMAERELTPPPDRQSEERNDRAPTPPSDWHSEETDDRVLTPPLEQPLEDDTMMYPYLKYRDELDVETHVYGFL